MKYVLVVGKGISGTSAARFLRSQGYRVKLVDDEELSELKESEREKFLSRLFSGLLFVVTSPAIEPNHIVLRLAKERGIEVIGELELGARSLKGDIIAVTGTNGKTSTVSLIYFLLGKCSKKVFLGGNIGVAVTSFASDSKEGDISVLECSSFQLSSVDKFRAHIAAILNITVDHLSYHKTMQNYIFCKQQIAKNQTEDDFLLVNADDIICVNNIPKTRAKIYYFSTKHKVCGCYIKRGCIYFNDNLHEIKLASLKNIKLLGEHNKSNILCACLAVWLETGDISLFDRLCDFKGVSHRIEYIKSIGGVEVYNDSKATNIDSTLVATKSFKQKVNLILGGSDKGYEFDPLFKALPKNVKNIVVMGETKHKILAAAGRAKFKNIHACNGFKEAVKMCFDMAKSGEVVLLSPACASFDCFKNYEERGNYFKKIIEEISLNADALGKGKKET